MPPTSRAVRDQERVCGSGPPERPLIDGQISYLNTALALIAPGNSMMPVSSTISGGSAAVRPALTKFRSRLVLTHHWARMGQGKFRELLGRRAEVSEAAGSGADANLPPVYAASSIALSDGWVGGRTYLTYRQRTGARQCGARKADGCASFFAPMSGILWPRQSHSVTAYSSSLRTP